MSHAKSFILPVTDLGIISVTQVCPHESSDCFCFVTDAGAVLLEILSLIVVHYCFSFHCCCY
jgi:hypothetical protein